MNLYFRMMIMTNDGVEGMVVAYLKICVPWGISKSMKQEIWSAARFRTQYLCSFFYFTDWYDIAECHVY